jgi:anti-sigma regulatory factor (Ser/Thr protein kinase)
MIDLSRTRAELLAEIDAPKLPGDPLSDLTDLRAASVNAHVRVCGRGRDELFPLLKIALSERFAAVPRLQIIRDLLLPLRNVLGNAYKHGNGCDPTKVISVEIVLTAKGALIAVTDEGGGFDVALTFRRFQGQESYFANHGVGFRNLHRSISMVSYENGGRTVLLCFRPTVQNHDRALNSHTLRKVLGAEWIQKRLSELPEFGKDGTRIESCRVYPARGCASDDCGNRYVLRLAGRNGRPAETRILTGRLHPTEAAAASDFEAATKLHDARISIKLHIPRPVALLAGEPRLVLYDFDPWMNLCEFFTHHGRIKTLRRIAIRVGLALAKLHCSQVGLRGAELDFVGEELQTMVVRSENYLQTLTCVPDLVNRFNAVAQRIESRAALDRQRILSPIHGALGWDCIHYGVDGRFYLYRFETCRWSDPGLDLGGFAADLLCFTLASYNEDAYRICLDAFLGEYNSQAAHPMDKDDLLPYIALALVERLRRAEASAKADAGQLLAALNAVLTVRPSVADQTSTAATNST